MMCKSNSSKYSYPDGCFSDGVSKTTLKIIILLAILSPVLSMAEEVPTNSFTTLGYPASSTTFVAKPNFWSREKTALTNRLAYWQNKFNAWGNTQANGYSRMMGSNLETSIIKIENYYLLVENLATSSPLTQIQKTEVTNHLNTAREAIEKAENNLVIISARDGASKPTKSAITLKQLKELVKDTVKNIRIANQEIGQAHKAIKDAI